MYIYVTRRNALFDTRIVWSRTGSHTRRCEYIELLSLSILFYPFIVLLFNVNVDDISVITVMAHTGHDVHVV